MGRNLRVESLRGLAIVLLVLYHAIDVPQLRVGALAWLQGTIDPFIMPAFALISGYVYALRPVRGRGLGAFASDKLQRIAIPMLIASTLVYLARGVLGADLSLGGVWRVWFFTYDVFWYLQALLVMFVAIACVDALRLAERPWTWLAVLAAACAAQRWLPASNLFSLWGAVYLMPSFLAGVGLQRFCTGTRERSALLVAGVVAGLTAVAYELAWFEVYGAEIRRSWWVAQVFGISLSAVFVLRLPENGVLIRLAAVSYTIYLYHAFGLSLGERLAAVASEDVAWIGLTAKVVLGLALPIALDQVVRRIPLARRLVLGRR